MEELHTFSARGIKLTIDMMVGHLRWLEITRHGRTIVPLHSAPWIHDPTILADPTITPNVRRLSGDFFCSPFGLNDVEPAPTHGWPANSAWRHLGTRRDTLDCVTATFELERRVLGARVCKELTLRDDHPFVYQQHTFFGGSGGVTAAHHTMVRMPAGGALDFSPKRYADLPPIPPENDPARGRSLLRYPARTSDLAAIPLADGSTADLHRFPLAERHEEFFMLVEAPGNALGWTSAVREATSDCVLVLKQPNVLPVTLLWISHGGRDYPPWSGRHTHVLGIEDARCWSLFGNAASVGDNALSREGVPTSFNLDPQGSIAVRQVIGAAPLPATWERITSVVAGRDVLELRKARGAPLALPYDASFLAVGSNG